ncbi:1-deoxy-D-xylulose-5-phosphate reductoisomerase [Candidatus Peregrinibacteria bacterium]|nr:MAG: 1-deoxy-D-xylulose-5-phosphate reductoisomerase [Candidatus Peregrinibacteria bacterium]
MKKIKVLLLGATGSIGSQTCEVLREFSDQFLLVGASANTNIQKLLRLQEEFSLPRVALFSSPEEKNSQKNILFKEEGLLRLIRETDADMAILATSGPLSPLLAKEIIKSGKHLLLASKEALVEEGEEILLLAKKHKKKIRPIDSEHSAIWQCLRSGQQKEVSRIFLTCSGGPFFDVEKWPKSRFSSVTPQEAVAHPNWSMGQKISVDSATLMNKALELIEAVYLFGVLPEKIEVVVHPESFLHSAVEFCDGSVVGQMGMPDMRIPIAYSLFYPNHPPLLFPKTSFFGKTLTFQKVDEERFPSLIFARDALKKKRCKVMNQANEQAVLEFISGKISFTDIFERVRFAVYGDV